MQDLDLWQPPAPLAQLTRLELLGCNPSGDGAALLTSVAAAAPRLEVLSWGGDMVDMDERAALAVEGHPCLRQLDVHPLSEDAWLHAAETLPALTRMSLGLWRSHVYFLPGEDDVWDARQTARLLSFCGLLGQCGPLEHLALSGCGDAPIQVVLAAVGEAVGDRLRSLTLCGICPVRTQVAMPGAPHMQAAAAGALLALAACYPHLEVLTLRFAADTNSKGIAEKLSWELLLPVPSLVRHCPALREVRAETGCTPPATWLRPGAQAPALLQTCSTPRPASSSAHRLAVCLGSWPRSRYNFYTVQCTCLIAADCHHARAQTWMVARHCDPLSVVFLCRVLYQEQDS